MILAATRPLEGQSSGDPASPSTAEVRSAVERLAKSRQLRGSLRLVAFLRYAVEATLAGQSDRIKSYTIAVEALDRDPSFDPQTDAIVRVEAGRLRQALARYYASGGKTDAVLIDLPRGSYVPRFHRRALQPDVPTSDRAPLQALFDRLLELHRQFEIITADIERAWKMLDKPVQSPRQRD